MAQDRTSDNDVAASSLETFKCLAEIPTVASAYFDAPGIDDSSGTNVQLTLSTRHFETLSRRTQRCSLLVGDIGQNGGQNSSFQSTPALDAKQDPVKARFVGKIGTGGGNATLKEIVLRETGATQSQMARRYVEIWRGERNLQTIDVTGKHESFIVNDTFGTFAAHGNFIAYTAQINPPKKAAEWNLEDGRSDRDRMAAYEFEPPLGERFLGQDHPMNFIVRLPEAKEVEADVYRLELPDQVIHGFGSLSSARLGQLAWCDDGKALVVQAHFPIADGRRFGTFACTNRPSAILKIPFAPDELKALNEKAKDSDCNRRSNPEAIAWTPADWTLISRPGYSARSPRISSNSAESTIVWLESETGGAHRDCDALVVYNHKGSTRVIVPIQDLPSAETGWPGIFADELPRQCLLGSSTRTKIAFTSIWGSRRRILLKSHHEEGPPFDISPPDVLTHTDSRAEGLWSYNLLCTDGTALLLATRSCSARPTQVLLGQLAEDGCGVTWKIVLDLSQQWLDDTELQSLSNLTTKVRTVKSSNEAAIKGLDMEVIVVGPTHPGKIPLRGHLLIPHGGPHGSSTTDFGPAVAALALAGYVVIQPNYHGSLGRGQRFAHSLLGKCGTLDVEDCHDCIVQLIKGGQDSDLPLYVDGGSHGGFLALHLVGRYPEEFTAAVARNPVTSANFMEGTNDIADWFYSEFGLPFNYDMPPAGLTAEQFAHLANASPLSLVEHVRAPILFLVGGSDMRVAPSQSKIYYHALRFRESRRQQISTDTPTFKRSKMLEFKDQGHALDGVEAELVAFRARSMWLM